MWTEVATVRSGWNQNGGSEIWGKNILIMVREVPVPDHPEYASTFDDRVFSQYFRDPIELSLFWKLIILQADVTDHETAEFSDGM